MGNQVKTVSLYDAKKIISNYITNSFLVEINGNQITTFAEYMKFIEKVLQFPESCQGNANIYLDWMRDLSWLSHNEYVFVIYNYDSFLKKDFKGKEWFMEAFTQIILPWWNYDVINHVVDGKTKKMSVYLVKDED